jgi:hypothetical protein
MSAANTPKTNVRNSVIECAQSLKKRMPANITATALRTALFQLRLPRQSKPQSLAGSIGIRFAS